MSRLKFTRAVLCGVLACAALTVSAPSALAQPYPNKTIRIIIPYLGGMDLISRYLASKLTPALGQQVVVDPRVGGNGKIGHVMAAKAPPDGYTLVMGAPPTVVNPFLSNDPGYDPVKDYAPIALLASIPIVLVVHPSVPAKNVQELVRLARAHPGKLAYPSAGVGSTSHLAGELFKSLTKTNLLHVPYKSGAIGLISAMAGEVDVILTSANSVEPFVNSGRMRALAVLDGKRLASMPKVPTSAEAGIPQLLVANWYALLAPAGTAQAIINQLNAESVKIMKLPETRERLTALGAEPNFSTPEQAGAYIREEQARWGRVVKEANIPRE